MARRSMRRLFAVTAVLAVCAVAQQTPPKPAPPAPPLAATKPAPKAVPAEQPAVIPSLYLGCEGPPRAANHRRSATLVAPNGSDRAYTETDSQPRSAVGRNLCVNTSRLMFAHGDGVYAPVFIAEPTPEDPGNALDPVDWSADSHFLLLNAWFWTDNVEYSDTTPIVYEPASGLFYRPDLGAMLKQRATHDCSFTAEALGFSARNEVILRLWPGDEEMTEVESCVRTPTMYLLDFQKQKLTPAPAETRVKKNATGESGSTEHK